MITHVKANGTGDVPNINTAILNFFQALDAYTIPANETLTVVLMDVGVYPVNYLSYNVSRSVQTKITIVPAPSARQQVTISQGVPLWLEWNTMLAGSYVNMEITDCILDVHGVFLSNHDQDVSIKNCPTLGNGILIHSENGQITLDRVFGTPLDLTIAGDVNTAARGANGGGPTFDRYALVMTYSRLRVLSTNKPVHITKCINCNVSGVFGLSRYIETADYGGPATALKIGSLLDGVFINFGGQSEPLMTLVDGGFYHRLIVGTLTGDTISASYAPILITSANLHFISIDRCTINGAPYGIKIRGGGIIDITSNVFKNISIAKIKNESCPFAGRLRIRDNRGPSAVLVGGCAVDCGPVIPVPQV